MGRLAAAGLWACRASDQLEAGRDVAPLVGAAALQLDPVRATQVGEVGRLEQHVAELGEGESLRPSAPAPSPSSSMYGIVKCLPTSRRKSSRRTSPSQSRLLTTRAWVGARAEIEEAGELVADGVDVGLDGRPIEKRSLARPTRRVPDQPRRPADHRHRLAARALEPHQAVDGHEMADVERAERRVESVVRADRLVRGQARLQAVRHVVDEAAPAEVRQQRREASRAHGVTCRRWHASNRPGGTERESMPSMLS